MFSNSSLSARRRSLLVAAFASVALPTAAFADCTASTSTAVTCTVTSTTGYSNLATGVGLTADSTAAISGPILLGDAANVTNAGSMTSTTTAPIVQVGGNGTITNNGTIALTSSGGSPAVLTGDNSTVTNNGVLTSTAGTPVIQFGQAGTFNNTSAATAAVTGNIIYGPNVNGGTSTLNNSNTAYGITGNIYSTGNTAIYNNGLITGSVVQTPTGGRVAITNDISGLFTGAISTGDTTALNNLGTLSITGASTLGSARLGVSSVVNGGTLNVGTTSAASQLIVAGSFVNGASGVLNLALRSSGASTPLAGSTYSQIYAAGSGGTATLGGSLNLVPASGFYASGSIYNVILADQSVTGNFATVNGSTLPFISFVPVGIVSVGAQQAYQIMAVRSTTYADAIASVATPTQLTIARAIQPLVASANAAPTGTAATLIGQIDLLSVGQSQTLFDQINPAPYAAYGQAITDQMNMFNRQILLRTRDPKNDEAQAGWWATGFNQMHVGKTSVTSSREGMMGLTTGFDMSGPHWLAGAAFGFSSASLRSGSETMKGHNNAYILGGYGAFDAGPIRATAQVAYDLGNMRATKALSLAYTTTTTAATSTTAATTTTTASDTTVTASARNHLLKASGMLGVNLFAAGLKVQPFAGLDYAKGAINGFTETGGDAADLTVTRIPIQRTDVLGGLDVTTNNGHFRPYVRAAYRSQIGGGSTPAISAYFSDDPTTSFTLANDLVGRRQVDVDAGINIVYEDGDLFLGYQGTLRKEMSDHGIQAGIRLQF